jgi:hypothetical protein
MRIKYSSIQNIVEANAAAPWVGPGLAEKLKRDAIAERTWKKDKKKNGSERALAWFRRSR